MDTAKPHREIIGHAPTHSVPFFKGLVITPVYALKNIGSGINGTEMCLGNVINVAKQPSNNLQLLHNVFSFGQRESETGG